MSKQGFETWQLGQHHVQRAPLHGGLALAEGLEQFGIAGTGTEHHALGTDFSAVHA
ncbi:hypothetical protein D9M73_263250 [compost metagenome]